MKGKGQKFISNEQRTVFAENRYI